MRHYIVRLSVSLVTFIIGLSLLRLVSLSSVGAFSGTAQSASYSA